MYKMLQIFKFINNVKSLNFATISAIMKIKKGFTYNFFCLKLFEKSIESYMPFLWESPSNIEILENKKYEFVKYICINYNK